MITPVTIYNKAQAAHECITYACPTGSDHIEKQAHYGPANKEMCCSARCHHAVNVKYLPRSKTRSECESTLVGDVKDLPRVLTYIKAGWSKLTGDLQDLPRAATY